MAPMKNLSKSERRLLAIGAIALGLTSLPWLGAGYGTFIFLGPYGYHFLPRLKILPPNGLLLYDLAEIPLHFMAILPGFDYAIHFAGEGRAVVRPFVFFLFWACVGLAFVWAGIRRKVLGLDVTVKK